MWNPFKKSKPILNAYIDDKELCSFFVKELPVEKKPEIKLDGKNHIFKLIDIEGNEYSHTLTWESGFFSFSIRVYETLTCQSDCIWGSDQKLSTERFQKGEISGIRFQPLYLPGCESNPEDLAGRGLFYRGFHFSGTITPGNVSLSCICDHCKSNFRIQSFHAGFSNSGYMYSTSGKHTIIIPDYIEGCPPAMGKAEIAKVSKLEEILPLAEDGASFNYLNPFRCPNCNEAFIDFNKYPSERENEYYGNYFFDSKPIHYKPNGDRDRE